MFYKYHYENIRGTMTNPINKKTAEQFISEIPNNLGIEIIGEYVNTDTKIEYKCVHGNHFNFPWKIRKMKARWGSCNNLSKEIVINTELIKKSPSCLKYFT